ncbi:MAG: hypothetical protein KAR40_13890 [Candidatus Sabulitectum sp.]|nr:hypothetical protein [Candidatus Sabulitectum sp.]
MTALVDIISQANIGIFSSSPTDIDAITGVVDLYYDESHSVAVTKTKFQVEDGSSRTDNAVVEPQQLVLKGIVSDLQGFLGGIVNVADQSRGKEAWGRILALKNSLELVTVVTTLGVYGNMMVVGADAVANSDTGNSLSFTINLEETLIVETETVQLAPVKLSGPADTKGSDAEGGLKQSEEATAEVKTVLQEIASGIGGIFN